MGLQVITFKSSREIDQMREAGQLVAEAHQIVSGMISPGVTTSEIDVAVERFFEEQGATPLFKGVPGVVPFPAVTCISIDDEVVHGIPGDRELKEGEIVSVDTGCRLNGWCGDGAWTYAVGQVDELRSEILAVGALTLEIAIREMGRRERWSQVAQAMEEYVKSAGFRVVEELVGHGIGREMHEDPQVPNYVSRDLRKHDFALEPGLVIAVEPMVNAGTRSVRLLDDHWTVVTRDGRPSVHFEHTIAMTDDGPELLTKGIGAGRNS